MRILHSLTELSSLNKPIHWAAGFFDGVHRGHQRVIASTSTASGVLRGVLTFGNHPLALLRPEAAPRLLTPDPAFKASLFAQLGVDVLLSLPFDAELAQKDAHSFLGELCCSCHVAGLSVGKNWRFGRGGKGDAALLAKEASAFGFTACIVDLLEMDEGAVSSSRIRSLLSEGRMEAANAMLGRPFPVVGTVGHGQRLARQLGFPTANITLPPCAALPLPGVYEVQARLGGVPWRGVANIGQRPTIDEAAKPTRLEAHFPGWSGSLYGQRLEVSLLRFIRPERRFPSLDALQAQMRADIAACSPPSPAL